MAAIAPRGYSWGDPNRGVSGEKGGVGQVKAETGEALPFGRLGLRAALVVLGLFCISVICMLLLGIGAWLSGDLNFTPPWR